MKIYLFKKRNIIQGLCASILMSLTSCMKDDLGFDRYEGDDGTIRVGAIIQPPGQTRTYYGSDEQETVASGIFYLTYPKAGNETSTNAIYRTATVNFDAISGGSSTGFAYFTNEEGVEKDLKWKHVWNEGKSSKTFYLHNLDPEQYTETYTETSSNKRTQSYQKVTFKETSPFYSIRPLDKEQGSNDIITGSVSATNEVNELEFTLNHRLSLLKFNVEVFASETDNWTVDLSRATVTLSNLYTSLRSFSINSPTSFGTSSSTYNKGYYTNRAQFTLRGNEDEDPEWEKVENGSYLAEDGLTYKKITYYSLEFVIPPQDLVSNYIPEFVVMVPKEDVTGAQTDKGQFVEYKGKLPQSMFNVTDGVMGNAPIATTFESGYQLTVSASINSPDTELHFNPVTVEAWINKGTFTINTNQGGIYNLKDFQNMVEAYRAGNRAVVEKYGYKTTDGSFVIQFWSNVEIPQEVLPGVMLSQCMKPDAADPIQFLFIFNGNVVKVPEAGEMKGLEDTDGQLELYNIVTGLDEKFTGVRTAEEMQYVIEILNGTETSEFHSLRSYAYFDNLENTLIVNVTGNFEMGITEVFQRVPVMSENYNVMFQMSENAEVNIVFSIEDDVKMVLTGSGDSSKISRIVVLPSGNVGVYGMEDFNFLKKCYLEYSQYFSDIMGLFCTKTFATSNWTIYFRTPLTVKGEEFFGALPYDSSSGRPVYDVNTSEFITIEDEFTPCSTKGTSYLKAMLRGGGNASAYRNEQMGNIVSYYNNADINVRNGYLWSQGRFDRETKRWIFPMVYLTYPNFICWCNWATVNGKMIPDESENKHEFAFDFKGMLQGYFAVRDLPSDVDPTHTNEIRFYTSKDGEEGLRRLCQGTYFEWLEEQQNGD